VGSCEVPNDPRKFCALGCATGSVSQQIHLFSRVVLCNLALGKVFRNNIEFWVHCSGAYYITVQIVLSLPFDAGLGLLNLLPVLFKAHVPTESPTPIDGIPRPFLQSLHDLVDNVLFLWVV
jgi:hypothetical protein